MKTYLLAAIVCIVLFVCLFSVTAFADDAEDTEAADGLTLSEPLISEKGARTAGRVLGRVGVIIPGYSYISVANDQKRIDSEVKSSYTPEEATAEINGILKSYSSKGEVSFGSESVHLEDSYTVDSRYDRQKVSTIIRNTGLTERSVTNIAAEWKFHNMAYDLKIMTASAEDADIDYVKDPRWYVNFVVGMLEVFRWL